MVEYRDKQPQVFERPELSLSFLSFKIRMKMDPILFWKNIINDTIVLYKDLSCMVVGFINYISKKKIVSFSLQHKIISCSSKTGEIPSPIKLKLIYIHYSYP